jgi:hypothetical protein
VTCPWYGCRRRIVRLKRESPLWHITPDGREPVPTPDNIAEYADGATVTFEPGRVTMRCPRGHVTKYGPNT